MSKVSILAEKFAALDKSAQTAITDLVDLLASSNSAPTLHRASKKGLENKPNLAEDDDVAPKAKRGRPAKVVAEEVAPKKRGRPAKVAEEVTEKKKPGRPAKTEEKVTVAKPVNGEIYDALVIKGSKTERATLKAAAIKKIEKVANDNSVSWADLKKKAEKKGVEITFGRGKPSEVGYKRKIGIAMTNAGVKF